MPSTSRVVKTGIVIFYNGPITPLEGLASNALTSVDFILLVNIFLLYILYDDLC